MFIPVRNNLFRWGTPDPEMDETMYGHLIIEDGKCILIDPPYVPGLIEGVERLGRIEAVIITTLDHTRGAEYIRRKTGAGLYIPEQMKSMTIDPEFYIIKTGIKNYEKYGHDPIFGLRPFRLTVEGLSRETEPYMDEYAFLTDHKELIVGDIAVGTMDNRLLIAPEWFPIPDEPHPPAHDAFREIAMESGAASLLSSHGLSIYGNLQDIVRQI